MFKSRKKRQQLKEAAAAAALKANTQSEIQSEIETPSKYKLLDDIHLAHDFRSSIILPQLNKDLDPSKLSKQQLHLAQLRDISESTNMLASQPPLSPPHDGTKQYQELAAWRHQRSQNRYSNGLFGGKQRGRPKPNQLRKYTNDHEEESIVEEESIAEEDDIVEDNIQEDQAPGIITNELPTPPLTATTNTAAPFQSLIKLIQEEADDSENDDIEEDEEELLEELYEPNSDTEENFFFQDFSCNPTSKKKSTPRRKSRSNKVMSKFDLSSFARDLHENRLSVMVQRESRIVMTEDDEFELEKLLERQRQRMSMMSTVVNESSDSLVTPPPPLPSLDLVKSHQAAIKINKRPASPNIEEVSNKVEVEQERELTTSSLEVPHMNSDHDSTTTTDNNSYTSNEDHHTKEIILKDDVPQKIATPIPVASISSSKSSNSIKTTTNTVPIDQLKRSVSTNSVRPANNVPIARKRSNLSSVRDIRNDAGRSNARKSVSMDDIHINLKENEHSVTSAALDWINQTESTTPLNPSSDPTSFVYKQGITNPVSESPVPQLTKSRSLFGSLRQVSRSKSHLNSGHASSGIKGLVRNFSSHHKPSSSITNNPNANTDAGMSRAAMAVIQHNVAKQEKQKSTPVILEEPTTETTTVTTPPQPPKRRSRSKSDANSNTNNLISHLISRAASSRRHNGTKIVNMENDESAAAKKRAQVVRKTIIYVQPDSLHNLLKNGGDGSSIKVPPMPTSIDTTSTNSTRNTLALSDGSLSPDDETIRSREYVTATKIVRQTSVRKRVVEDNTNELKPISGTNSLLSETSTLLERQGSANNKKRYQLQSVDEHDLLDIHGGKYTSSSSSGSSSNSSSQNGEYMEGLELREMSDGSVIWGLVKKQGNRKSFFAPNQQRHGHYDHVDDEDADEDTGHSMKQHPQYHQQRHSNSLSPPPIPKRSPRRQVAPATTDVYYSNQVNLPNLLKMMHDQQQHPGDDSNDEDPYNSEFNERAMSSVDDQLDEMMRILTSQQQQVQQH